MNFDVTAIKGVAVKYCEDVTQKKCQICERLIESTNIE